MSRILTIEISEPVYNAIELRAQAASKSTPEFAASQLEEYFSGVAGMQHRFVPVSAAEVQAARNRFEGNFGAINLGAATGAGNEQIDIDLAREYADTHEG
jgi:hypothetical protein